MHLASSTAASPPTAPPVGAVEAEAIAKDFVAKQFDLREVETLATSFNASYGSFTISLKRVPKHHVTHITDEEPQHHPATSPEPDKPPRRSNPHARFSYDVTVDKTGSVVAWTRLIRTSEEAEAIAKEYATERHELTHFIPYTTTFDGTYFTVYAGGLIYEQGIVHSALKIYKSKFYDVKVDKSGIVVGWTTEGLVTHYTQKFQRLR